MRLRAYAATAESGSVGIEDALIDSRTAAAVITIFAGF